MNTIEFGPAPSQQPNVEAVIASMGAMYLCHPSNRVRRKTPFRATAKSLRAALGSGKNVSR
jgi:hypothetical protein